MRDAALALLAGCWIGGRVAFGASRWTLRRKLSPAALEAIKRDLAR